MIGPLSIVAIAQAAVLAVITAFAAITSHTGHSIWVLIVGVPA